MIDATETICEIMWIRHFLSQFEIDVSIPKMFCDNQQSLAIAHTTGYHSREKHNDVKYKYLAECVEKENVKFVYRLTCEMMAGALMTSLRRTSIRGFLGSMVMSVRS